MTATRRPLDSGRTDSLGRPIRISDNQSANRSDAPAPGTEPVSGWTPPAGVAGWMSVADGVDVATKVEQLGWPAASFIEVESHTQYDDSEYFTPRFNVMVDQRLVDQHGIANAIDTAARLAARHRYKQLRDEGSDHDEAVDQLDQEMNYNLDRTINECGNDHFEKAGLVVVEMRDDPFGLLSTDSIDTTFDPDEFNPDSWRGVDLEFPNGTPSAYEFGDDTAWMTGYTVTGVGHDTYDINTINVTGVTADGIVGYPIDDNGEPDKSEGTITMPFNQIAKLEIP